MTEIVQTGAPVLRARAFEVTADEMATPALVALVASMVDAMRAAPGVGLAAPQIGVPKRIIVLEDRADFISRLTSAEKAERERAELALRVIVNPVMEILDADDTAVFFEGCLSVAGFVGLVPRARRVVVTGVSEHGEPVSLDAQGWAARIFATRNRSLEWCTLHRSHAHAFFRHPGAGGRALRRKAHR